MEKCIFLLPNSSRYVSYTHQTYLRVLKSRDAFRHSQYTFWTLRTHRKLQKSKPCKSVKSKENLGFSKNLKIFHCFDHRKVHFPASKIISECPLYPPDLSQGVSWSLEILLDTHNILFRHLDRILETIEKISDLRHIVHF